MNGKKSLDILIVDDDANNRKLLETLLHTINHSVFCASTGNAALERLTTHIPDIIMLDLMMPGLDGFEVLQRIRANPQTWNIPVIMVTALDDSASQARLKAAGITEILLKPIDRWALNEAVERAAAKVGGAR